MVSVQTDSVKFTSFAPGSKTFTLEGGIYLMAATGITTGNVSLSVLGPDGATFLPVNLNGAAVKLTANGTLSPIWLPPGTYELTVVTDTISVSLAAVPHTQIH